MLRRFESAVGNVWFDSKPITNLALWCNRSIRDCRSLGAGAEPVNVANHSVVGSNPTTVSRH